MAKMGVLIDMSKCIGCRACQIACKEWNGLPPEKTENRGTYQNPPRLSPVTWTLIEFREEKQDGKILWHFRRVGCHHCTYANCMEACPVGAIKRSPSGMIYVDHSRCMGCKNCVMACPFGIPQMDPETGMMYKCTGCYDRIENGLPPACAKACPTGALTFGPVSQLKAIAQERLKYLWSIGYKKACLYGDKELGGLGFFYILLREPGFYGLPEEPKSVSRDFFNVLTNSFMSLIAMGIVALGSLLALRERTKKED